MKKQHLTVLMALTITLSLAACGETGDAKEEENAGTEASAEEIAATEAVLTEEESEEAPELAEVPVEIDYWDYIHDELLPELEYSGTEPVWSRENPTEDYDILAAEVLDMNEDGTDDLLLYLVKDAEIYVDLYTRVDGTITLLGETEMEVNRGVNLSYAWLGTMEVDGNYYLNVQYVWDYDSSQAHYINFYRFGESGLELAAKLGYFPAAGPRNDKTYLVLNDFCGKTEDTEKEYVLTSKKEVRKTVESLFIDTAADLGLPELTTVEYTPLGQYTMTSVPTWWESDTYSKSLFVTDEADYLGNDASGHSMYNYEYTVEDDTPYQEEMAARES